MKDCIRMVWCYIGVVFSIRYRVRYCVYYGFLVVILLVIYEECVVVDIDVIFKRIYLVFFMNVFVKILTVEVR